MLNACLRVLASERERKTKHKTIIQNFQKQGPRSSGHMRSAKVLVMSFLRSSVELRRSSGSPSYIAPRSSGHHGLQKILGARNSRSSGGFPAPADIKFLGFPECVLELKMTSKVSKLIISAQTSHIHVLTWYKH